MQNGTMQTLKKGTNRVDLHVPEWRADVPRPRRDGVGTRVADHGPATDKTGFIYMLAGDTGASNTDPYATAKTADNHWIRPART